MFPSPFPHVEPSFLKCALLTLEALLERFSTAASALGEKGLPPYCGIWEGHSLTLVLKENHPECLCKVKSCVLMGTLSSPHTPFGEPHLSRKVMRWDWVWHLQDRKEIQHPKGKDSLAHAWRGFLCPKGH